MTFSLVGRCARTGMLGAAVTTSAIGVGARCPFARAGVGAVLTQHRTDPRLGPLALDLLAHGFTAEQTLAAIAAATPHRDWRQLAVLDASGGSATFSGAHVRPERSEARGTDCAAIANIVRSAAIPAEMVAAFEKAPDRPLPDRLLAGLMAGQSAGGEFRPVVSAALLIVHRESFPYVDLRVDQHDQPIEALARLWDAYRAEADPYVQRAVDPDASSPPASQA
jgi:uncharacterized Ntn-hydrolase superfamily protein